MNLVDIFEIRLCTNTTTTTTTTIIIIIIIITRSLREEMEGKERFAMEKIRLQEMADAKEHQEILRRIREEARMRYLEERRRYIENKDEWDAEKAKAELQKKRDKFKKEARKMQIRIRGGNFIKKGHEGHLSYYDDVRAKPVDWIQYEDEEGVPYYYDPVLGTTSYDPPIAAGEHHALLSLVLDAYHDSNGDDEYTNLYLSLLTALSINIFLTIHLPSPSSFSLPSLSHYTLS